VKETVPLDAIAQSLWLRMIRDDLLEGRTNSKLFLHNSIFGQLSAYKSHPRMAFLVTD
jgi:hypothetical protein